MKRTLGIILAAFLACQSQAEERLRVAVASNFVPVLSPIAEQYSEQYGVDVQVISGSTGKLYAQIVNGAPFDVFLSADKERAQLLVGAGKSVEADTRLYAIGQLIIWSQDSKLQGEDCRKVLEEDQTSRLAIANPKIAPYGRAAMEYLESVFDADNIKSRLLVGENVAQAGHFAASGGARFGLVPFSLFFRMPSTGCMAQVPADTHQPIEQHAIAIAGGAEQEALRFLDFLHGETALSLLEFFRYGHPLLDETE